MSDKRWRLQPEISHGNCLEADVFFLYRACSAPFTRTVENILVSFDASIFSSSFLVIGASSTRVGCFFHNCCSLTRGVGCGVWGVGVWVVSVEICGARFNLNYHYAPHLGIWIQASS